MPGKISLNSEFDSTEGYTRASEFRVTRRDFCKKPNGNRVTMRKESCTCRPRLKNVTGTLCFIFCCRGKYGKKTAVWSRAAGDAFLGTTASTRKAKDGTVNFALLSSMLARTDWPAKICSGSSMRRSTPASEIEERIPDIRMMDTRQARIRNSRLLPVFNAASATSNVAPK